MVFIGSNVPHLWLSDPVFYKKDSTLHAKLVIMYINPKIFESMLSFVKEFDGVREILEQATTEIKPL